jgi:hypothetical protein
MLFSCLMRIAIYLQEANRWLTERIQSDEVLARVAQHTLVHPIRHGARVPFVSEDLDQLPLFDEAGDSEQL